MNMMPRLQVPGFRTSVLPTFRVVQVLGSQTLLRHRRKERNNKLLSIMHSTVYRTALPVNTRYFKHTSPFKSKLLFYSRLGDGWRGEWKVVACYVSISKVKSRFKILECATCCYSPPHDLKGQAAAWAVLQAHIDYADNIWYNKTEPLPWKQTVLWNDMSQCLLRVLYQNNRLGYQITPTTHPHSQSKLPLRTN